MRAIGWQLVGTVAIVVLLPAGVWARPAPRTGHVAELEREVELLRTTVEAAYREIDDFRQAQQAREKATAAAAEAAEAATKAIEALSGRLGDVERRLEDKTRELQAAHEALAEATRKPRPTYPLRFDAQLRIRPVFQDNLSDLSDATGDRDAYYGHRLRLGALFEPVAWLQVYAQLQNASRFGLVDASGRAVDLQFGVQQSHLRIQLGDIGYGEGYLQAGRQELQFGSGRLVGSDDFALQPRFFDGFLAHYNYRKFFDADAFLVTLAERQTPFGSDRYLAGGGAEFHFLELFAPQLGHGTLAVELLGLDDRHPEAERKLINVGVRLFGDVVGVQVDYESVWQFGQIEEPDRTIDEAGGPYTRALDHFAAAHFLKLGYAFERDLLGFGMAFGGTFSWASGDANWRDKTNARFDPLYPNAHPWWGQMDLFGWSNVLEGGMWFHTEPTTGLFFDFQYHHFRMVEPAGQVAGFGTQAAAVVAPGVYNRDATLGHEIDLLLGYSFNQHFALEAGYGVFLPGAGAAACQGLGGQDGDPAHWFYLKAQADL